MSMIGAGLYFATIAPAHAYLDPGTASIAIQVILAGLAGAIATVKFWGYRIKSFFVRKPEGNKGDDKDA